MLTRLPRPGDHPIVLCRGSDPGLPGGQRRRHAEQVIRQPVGSAGLMHRLRCLAPRDLHLHHRRDRTIVTTLTSIPIVSEAVACLG